MKLRYLLTALALTVVLPTAVAKVGYVDSEIVIARFEEAREARTELEQEIARFKTEADSFRVLYQQALDEYQIQEMTLSEEGRQAKLAEVRQLKQRYDSHAEDIYRKGGRIDQKTGEIIAPLVQKISETVGDIARRDGFTLVLDAAKIDIIHSASGLDLTQAVIEELNREFAVADPTYDRKFMVAVLPIFATNDEARQERIDFKIRDFVYNLIRAQPNIEMSPNAQVDEQLTQRGISGRPATGREAIDISSALNIDYALLGTCQKEGRQIEFTLTIVDVRMSDDDLKTETGQAAREERLNEEVARVAQLLLAAITGP